MGEGLSSSSGLIMDCCRRETGEDPGPDWGTAGSGPNVDIGRGAAAETRRLAAGCAGKPERRFSDREGDGAGERSEGPTGDGMDCVGGADGRAPSGRGGGSTLGGRAFTVPERLRFEPVGTGDVR